MLSGMLKIAISRIIAAATAPMPVRAAREDPLENLPWLLLRLNGTTLDSSVLVMTGS
ncbi:hypothetical protein D3C81_2246050 [compost metagenome]